MIEVRRVPDLWRRCDVTVRDLSFALLLAAMSFLPGFRSHGTQMGDLPARPFDALTVVMIAVECLPLAVRRRWPAGCLALVSLGFAGDQLRSYHTVAGTALVIALLSAGRRDARRVRSASKAGASGATAGRALSPGCCASVSWEHGGSGRWRPER